MAFSRPVEGPRVDGRNVPASRLGFRITTKFATTFLGRIFMHPTRSSRGDPPPETQDRAVFADSVEVMAATHERVAMAYVTDGTIASACPARPHVARIMADEIRRGVDAALARVRALFTRESVLASQWYAARLDAAQAQEVARRGRYRAVVGLPRHRWRVGCRQNGSPCAPGSPRSPRRRTRAASAAARDRLVGSLGRQPTFR